MTKFKEKSFKKMWWRVRLVAVLSLVTFFIFVVGTILAIIVYNPTIPSLLSLGLIGIGVLSLISSLTHFYNISKISDYRIRVWKQAGKDDNGGFNLKLLKRAFLLYCQSPY